MAKIKENHNSHGWLIAAFLREMSERSGKPTFECVESSFDFNGCLRQGSVDAPRWWQKMATQILAIVEEKWMKNKRGILLKVEEEGVHQICSFMWAYNFWIKSHSKKSTWSKC